MSESPADCPDEMVPSDRINAPGCSKYSTNKAGMQGLDKATVMKVILENSKGSKFYENELRRERLLLQQLEPKLKQIRSLTRAMIQSGEREADTVLQSIKARLCFSRCIVHLDMDAFYAAVEIRDRPELRHQPVAVGSNSMLSTSNYIARRFGVRAGLPGFLGRKLCPTLQIIPLDFARYTAAGHVVRSVLRGYAVRDHSDAIADDDAAEGKEEEKNQENIGTVAMVTASLDEAYVDLTGHLTQRASMGVERRSFWPRANRTAPMLVCRCRKPSSADLKTSKSRDEDDEGNSSVYVSSKPISSETNLKDQSSSNNVAEVDIQLAVCTGCGLLLRSGRRVFGVTASEAVREIRFRIFCATQLTCSAGIGPNTLIAKIASDWSKPSGQFEVTGTLEAVTQFMQQLPVRKVPGIGHVSERRLEMFGIRTCAELITKRGALWHVSTKSALAYYLRIGLGHSDDDWLPHSSRSNSTISMLETGVEDAGGSSSVQTEGVTRQSELNRKSMSVERTFQDSSDPDGLMSRCRQLAAILSVDLKEEHVKGKHITVKMKLDSFEVRSRSQMLPDYTNEAEIIATFAVEILREEIVNERSSMPSTISPKASTSQQYPEKRVASSRALCLRLMGLRMASLLPVEMCPQIRQRSIEEALVHVLATKASEDVSTDPETLTSSVQSSKTQGGSTGTPISSKISTPTSLGRLPSKNNKQKAKKEKSKSLLLWTKSPTRTPTEQTSNESQTSLITCPVCNKVFQNISDVELNRHLDDCLSREVIAEAVRESQPSSEQRDTLSGVHQSTEKRSFQPSTTCSTGTLRKKPRTVQTSHQKSTQGPLDRFVQ